MDRVNRYILAIFFPLFLSLFFTLFFLVSVIFFITLARLTALISVSFIDLGEIFLYAIPEILTYTLPVTYFVAIAMTAFKMSKENEMIVLFALSLSPAKIARFFFVLSFLTSAFLLLNTIFFMPLSKQMSNNFISLKRMEAKLNLKESAFGQKFSNWNVFVGKNNKDIYKDIVLYQKGKDSANDKFILAREARLDRNESLLSFKLFKGKVFDLAADKITEVDYNTLKMIYNPKLHELKSSAIMAYWQEARIDKKRASLLSFSLLVALFPLATFLFALAFGTAHMRHDKPNVYLYTLLVVIAYYVATYKLAGTFLLIGTAATFLLFFIVSLIIFHKKVMQRY